jgi:hypothetical protein
MYLLLILACVFTIAVILLLNIKDPLQQVFVFLVTLLVFMGFNFLFADMAKKSEIPSALALNGIDVNKIGENVKQGYLDVVQKNKPDSNQEQLLHNILNISANETSDELRNLISNKIKDDEIKNTNYLLNPLNSDEYDPAYTPDKIIPNCSYNLDDCTNDLSCIIPPSSANLFGPVTPNKNTLDPNPLKNPERKCQELPDITIDRTKHCSNCAGILPSAKKFKNNCSDIEKVVNNYDRLCVHCKVGVRMNSRCFDGKDLPIEYYPI